MSCSPNILNISIYTSRQRRFPNWILLFLTCNLSENNVLFIFRVFFAFIGQPETEEADTLTCGLVLLFWSACRDASSEPSAQWWWEPGRDCGLWWTATSVLLIFSGCDRALHYTKHQHNLTSACGSVCPTLFMNDLCSMFGFSRIRYKSSVTEEFIEGE